MSPIAPAVARRSSPTPPRTPSSVLSVVLSRSRPTSAVAGSSFAKGASLRHAAAVGGRCDHRRRHRLCRRLDPAAFAVPRDPVVIWTANAFALLGLGSLLALVDILVRRFR